MLLLVPKISLCISIFSNSATFTCGYVMSVFLLTLYSWTDLLWGILLTCCTFWSSCAINLCYCCRTCTFSTTSTKSWTRLSAPVCVRWILMLSSHPAFPIPPSGHYPRSCYTKITYAFLVSPLQLVTGHRTACLTAATSVFPPSPSRNFLLAHQHAHPAI